MVKQIIVNLTKQQEEQLADAYNRYIELKEKFEKQTGLKVIKSIDNYNYCIIQNNAGKFIVGKVFKNCISIGSGIIVEHDKIEQVKVEDYNNVKY